MRVGIVAVGEGSVVDTTSLIDVLLRVAQTARLQFNEWLSEFDLNDGRYLVLKILATAGGQGCSQADLADRLSQSESNVSTLIERMQRDGLVERLRSSADKRKRVLLIGEAGRSLLNRIDGLRATWEARCLRGVTHDEQANLIQRLLRLGRTLESSTEPNLVPLGVDSNSALTDSLSIDRPDDLVNDPQSPQFALQQMLLALSSPLAGTSMERGVA